jgi:hypothetical protein
VVVTSPHTPARQGFPAIIHTSSNPLNTVNHEQIIDRAIEQVLSERLLLSAGDAVAHSSDSMTYEFIKHEQGNAVVSYKNVTKTFPMWEVFDPNIEKAMVLRMKFTQRF